MTILEIIKDSRIPKTDRKKAWDYWKFYQLPKDYKESHAKIYELIRESVGECFAVKNKDGLDFIYKWRRKTI